MSEMEGNKMSINISIFNILQKQPSPSEVVQWSNHRVMEWLRAVDLAEYAPNLRGSGVHGGLIVSKLSLSGSYYKSLYAYNTCLETYICFQYALP